MNLEKKIKLPEFLSGHSLKLIAILSMIIDHAGTVIAWNGYYHGMPGFRRGDEALYSVYVAMHNIGRWAFPIFAFLLVEGFYHTSNRFRYAARLLLFAFLSEIPFDFGLYRELWYWEHQNVFWTLFCGLLTIWAADELRKWMLSREVDLLLMDNLWLLSLVGIGAVASLFCYGAKTDYNYAGIILICAFYLFHDNRLLAAIVGAISFLWEPFSMPAFLLILLYNGKRGKQMKYLFYLFYPAHLLLLGFIRFLIFYRSSSVL